MLCILSESYFNIPDALYPLCQHLQEFSVRYFWVRPLVKIYISLIFVIRVATQSQIHIGTDSKNTIFALFWPENAS